MSSLNIFTYLIVHREFYEPLEYYKPKEDDFLNLVRSLLPEEWQIIRNGVWFQCYPDKEVKLPKQGWKIHISGTIKNAKEILKVVVPILAQNSTSFKFAVDMWMLALINSKNWYRGSSGKFITVYPIDEDNFKFLIEELYQKTKDFEGPYILSDRRYKDSKVIYYRYGGILPYSELSVDGSIVSYLASPDGETIQDIRYPYFNPPGWVNDPFRTDENTFVNEPTLKDGKYTILSALNFSNSGGVYLARDNATGETVVVKEARPFVGLRETGEDAIALLSKEYRLLKKIEHYGIAPKAVDFFKDWEHCFLVEEYIEGTSIRGFSARNNPILLHKPDKNSVEEFLNSFKKIFTNLIKAVRILHENNIVFGDLSPNNLILLPDLNVKIIDFEGAYEIGKDKIEILYTPGFALPEQIFNEQLNFERDYYSIGAIMLFYFMPINSMLDIKPDARFDFIRSIFEDLGISEKIGNIVLSLMTEKPEARPRLEVVEKELTSMDELVINEPDIKIDTDVETYKEICNGIIEYIKSVASYDRADRLFPSDPQIFATNPLSLAYGASGVAYALKKISGDLPDGIIEWIISHEINAQQYPPGLYVGLSGIAWCLLEIGFKDEATKIISLTFEHPLLYKCPDLFYGVSGWGMSCLKFWIETEDEIFLDKAIQAGEHLLKTHRESDKGYYWDGFNGDVHYGLAHGSSGIALFLLYLYLATGKERYLESGLMALEFDINSGETTSDGGLTWHPTPNSPTLLPYWKYGSAGIGSSILRYYKLTGDHRYKELLEKIFIDVDRKYTIFPGKFLGLAGIGDFLLDLYNCTEEVIYLESAYKVATGLKLFKIKKSSGIAYPGDNLHRISCDYGTGGAGIALFLNRLITNAENDFLIDELIYAQANRR